jgi:tetratricopeptide (TPR) repeat protein
MNTAAETDEAVGALYRDSLLSAWERQEAAGFYLETSDFDRGINMLQVETPDRKGADVFLRRAIKTNQEKSFEGYISYAYYNQYMIYFEATEDEMPALKKQLISDYFEMSHLVTKGNMSIQTQEALTTTLNYFLQSADDLIPEIPAYIESLPGDLDAAKAALKNMIKLMEDKGGAASPEFEMLVDKMIELDPTSLDALEAKATLLEAQKKYSDAIAVYKKIRDLTEDADKKLEMSYKITYSQYKLGSYSAAYNSAMAISGKYKGDALVIASDCVAKRANSCGSSTFERKCNFLYASQLAGQAQANGASVGNRVANYKNSGPSSADCFDEGNPGSVTLTCYGVTVTPCN